MADGQDSQQGLNQDRLSQDRLNQDRLSQNSEDALMVVGRLVAPQGLRGELRALPLSDFPERFTRPGSRWLRQPNGQPRPVELTAGRPLPGKDLFVIRIEGCDSREAAEALVGQELLVPASDRPRLAKGEFHLMDLVGLEARLLPGGDPLGRVTNLLHAGNDLLELELAADRGGRTILVPFVQAIVPEVNLAEGWIGLTPPAGLLEL
jgi:16S rRNA processing protein RimM